MSRVNMFAAVALPCCLVISIAGGLAQSSADSQAAATSPAEAKQAAPAGAADLGQTSAAEATVSPGPGENERKALLGRIMEAKAKGIGISNYIMAFQALDQSVKSGGSSADILKRVDSLNSSLDEQFKRSAILKVQKLPPPVAASSETPHLGAAPGGGKMSPEMVKQLQAKFGDKLPPDLKGKLPEDLTSDPSKLMDMLKNFKK